MRKPRSERATCLSFCSVNLLHSSRIPPLTSQTRLHHRSCIIGLSRISSHARGHPRRLEKVEKFERKYLSSLALLQFLSPFCHSLSHPLCPQSPRPFFQAGPTALQAQVTVRLLARGPTDSRPPFLLPAHSLRSCTLRAASDNPVTFLSSTSPESQPSDPPPSSALPDNSNPLSAPMSWSSLLLDAFPAHHLSLQTSFYLSFPLIINVF